jgi:hypothetical protein
MLETICEVLEDAYKRNWITSRDGNVSIRHHDRDHFYITPSGVRKQTLQPDQFKKIIVKPPLTWNEPGTGLLAERWGWKEDQYTDISAKLRPSGEIPLHFGLQKQMGQHTGEVRVVSDQIGQPTFSADLAKQIVELVLSKAPAGIYHGTNSGQATRFEFAQEIFSLAGADVSRVIQVSTSEFPRPAKRPAYSVLSHDAWVSTSVPAMRNWKIALSEAMPAIISAVKMEE